MAGQDGAVCGRAYRGDGTRVNVLEEIIEGVRADLAERQARSRSMRSRPRRGRSQSAKDGVRALRGEGVAVIAEVKRSSPSKGALAAIADPAALAGDYELGGASVISVLTERRRFGGSLQDLKEVRAPGRHPDAAQGLHRHQLPALGGPRLRRRPGRC